MQAFAPEDEVLLFQQKDPKPCLPWHGPPGPSTSTLNHNGCATFSAQTMLAKEADSGRERSRAQRIGQKDTQPFEEYWEFFLV